jgi:hypothetical protein
MLTEHTHDRHEVAGNAAEYEEMPNGMCVRTTLPQIEGHAAGVTQPAGPDPRELGGRQTRAELFEGDDAARSCHKD